MKQGLSQWGAGSTDIPIGGSQGHDSPVHDFRHSCTGAAEFETRCGGARTERVRAPSPWCGRVVISKP